MPISATQPRLSIVVPLFNEEDNVELLHERLRAALDDAGQSFEMIFVDDGSTDATFSKAAALARRDPQLRAVKLRANSGQTPAMVAGIDLARGEVIITMDGDLQNDPRDIPSFLEKIDEGYEIVVGWRHKRQDKLVTRKIPSKIANWIIGKVTGVPIRDNGCSLKAYRSDVIKCVPLYSEMHRFIPAMASLSGARIAEIRVRHHARQFGVSKYGLSRIYKVILDLIAIKTLIGFAGRPLLWFVKLSAPFVLLTFITLPISLYYFLTDNIPGAVNVAGMTLVFLATASFFIALGFLGELIFRTGNQRLDRLARVTARETPARFDRIDRTGAPDAT